MGRPTQSQVGRGIPFWVQRLLAGIRTTTIDDQHHVSPVLVRTIVVGSSRPRTWHSEALEHPPQNGKEYWTAAEGVYRCPAAGPRTSGMLSSPIFAPRPRLFGPLQTHRHTVLHNTPGNSQAPASVKQGRYTPTAVHWLKNTVCVVRYVQFPTVTRFKCRTNSPWFYLLRGQNIYFPVYNKL